VAYITERERGLEKVHEVLATIRSLPIVLLPADEKVVLAAAHIKANHRLAYADAFAAATAKLWQGRLLTGDPEFDSLNDGEITVEWLTR
jgi:predicted nucleic acid-binding protein